MASRRSHLDGRLGRTVRRVWTNLEKTLQWLLERSTSDIAARDDRNRVDAANPEEERTQGTVLVNTYLAQFKRGWSYTFIYELGEGEGGGGNQGLFHQDWTPKLAATYIHNLTSILADDIRVATPGKLDYSIANAPSTVHDLLLQKSNGVFELVIWGEQVTGSNNITVGFGNDPPNVRIYDTTIGHRTNSVADRRRQRSSDHQ